MQRLPVRFWYSFMIPHSDSSRLLCLTSSSTLLHLLCDVSQINKSHLNLLPFAWQEYPQDVDLQLHLRINLTRPMTPQLIPQQPVAIPQHCHHFHGHWARRNLPLPYTQGQLIVITGVEDLPLAQVLLCDQPDVCQLVRAICNYNLHPGNLPSAISRVASSSTEFCDPLHNDPYLGPSFWHEDFSLDHTNFHTLQLLHLPAQTTEDKHFYISNLSSTHFQFQPQIPSQT